MLALKLFLILAIASSVVQSNILLKGGEEKLLARFFDAKKQVEEEKGTLWALVIAGSNGWWNYRHQADACHAYHLLKEGGLKDENIIVMMYDDIADNSENPHKGKIFNKPDGPDLYVGVPMDYWNEDVNDKNFYAVLSGNKSAVVGTNNTGKVLATGPNDHVFIFFTDHGGPGVLGMPGNSEFLYAKDLINVLKAKFEAKSYKSILFYLEACESGSIFQGLLPDDWNIYALTAANAEESSWGTYCPPDFKTMGIDVCLGDLFSVAWMEDTEEHNRLKETITHQYKVVKKRTAAGDQPS